MTAASRFCVFTIIALCFTSALAIRRHGVDATNVSITVTNALPENSQWLQIKCDSKWFTSGMVGLQAGGEYSFRANPTALYYCEAFWGRVFASWHAFEPQRDRGHATVFWKLVEDDIYRSWDNKSAWKKMAEWETE